MKTKFLYNGVEGTLDLTAVPAETPGSTTAGNIVVFGDGDGQELDDSGKSFSTDVTLSANSDDLISTQRAIKTYVDAFTSGINFEAPVYAATTGALTATYANGASGVGATLTNSGAQAAFAVDGVSPPINSRILVKNQGSTFQNGCYTLTTVGSGATNWVLTRATDYDNTTEIEPGDMFIVLNGSTLASSGWLQTATVATIGTDPITFTQNIYSPTLFLQVANNLSELTGTAATARGNLGLGTVATQDANNIALTGGIIDGTTIGGVTAAAGTFLKLKATEGQVINRTAVTTTPYVVLVTDYFLGVDTSTAKTIHLPNAPEIDSVWVVKDSTGNAASNNITVTTPGGVVLIDGAASVLIAGNYNSLNFVFNGTSYEIW